MQTDTLTPAARIELLAKHIGHPIGKPNQFFVIVDPGLHDLIRDLASAATTAAHNQGQNDVQYWICTAGFSTFWLVPDAADQAKDNVTQSTLVAGADKL